ncbi:Nucleoside-diphosphate-sugar pyrophosphorylase involved in lipopolysaccharide biosynthesis/translation initiation factor 2B, gamma/epsilon subunits (eIF-2Bgamma/eIF-2Bepsilon) [Alteromonadaceae bacterium Bs31]|nr:Nucleoside-diphosphate-sugar pyrophosphorylase involved in lipopolysaccharide biosynthesis/translation initiation factor 2B, gamma/epsilon subunits (eIF-2Bgamma/eIF-2Bepsilon) [Alteromonadaceae bacterium Bs31]
MIESWNRIVITPDFTIREAWRVLDKEGLRIIVIVGDGGRLLGTVTDGDIRRGLLSDVDIEDPIQSVMNSAPIVVEPGKSFEELIDLMEELRLLALPVVDEGRLVGVAVLQELLDKPVLENPVFLMAGGFGSRLRPLTDGCPKPMLKIGNKPILEIAINRFKKAGFRNFYISIHYLPHLIQDYFGDGSGVGVNIRYVHEDQPLGTGGALGLLPLDIPSDLPVIVMNGDILTKININRLLDFHESNSADATMCVREYEYQIPYGVINGSGSTVISMEEKPTQRFSVNAGIYVVSPSIVRSVPKNRRVDLPSLLEEKISKGANICMFPFHEYWLDIGRVEDFNRAQTDIHTLGLL